MPKKEPPNEKRFSLKPLTTRQALEKALKGKKASPKKPQGSSSRKPQTP